MLSRTVKQALDNLFPTHELDNLPASAAIKKAFFSKPLDGYAIMCENDAVITIHSRMGKWTARLLGASDSTMAISQHLKSRGLVTHIVDDREPMFGQFDQRMRVAA